MKQNFVLLIALLLIAPTTIANERFISLKELVKSSDVIVEARLSQVKEYTRKSIDYGSGSLVVTKVIRGKAKVGSKLRLEWRNHHMLVCPRVEHGSRAGYTLTWLLRKDKNGAFQTIGSSSVLEKGSKELQKVLKSKK
jgi:hypothetical protein